MNKPSYLKKSPLLRPLPIPNRPFESIEMSFMISLRQSGLEKYDDIFLIVDRLSKVACFVPTKTDADALSRAFLLLDNWVAVNGLPKDLVYNRDAKFTSDF